LRSCVGLERRPVPRLQHPLEGAEGHLGLLVEAEDLARVLGLALRVLLPVGEPDLGIGRHRDSGLGAVDAGLPRPGGRDDRAALQLLRVLAEVPDVAVAILGVPVPRVLHDPTVGADDVVHDGRLDAEDRARPVGDRHHDPPEAALAVLLAVDPPAAREERQVRVVDARDELGRVELEWLASLRERRRRVAAAAGDHEHRQHRGE
jgi:hypothetical protein